MKAVDSATARWFRLAGQNNACQTEVHGELVNGMWSRAKSMFSGKGSRQQPRQKSESWWAGLCMQQDAGGPAEESPGAYRSLPRPLTVEDVLRRGASAMEGQGLEMEGRSFAEEDS